MIYAGVLVESMHLASEVTNIVARKIEPSSAAYFFNLASISLIEVRSALIASAPITV